MFGDDRKKECEQKLNQKEMSSSKKMGPYEKDAEKNFIYGEKEQRNLYYSIIAHALLASVHTI